MLQPGFKPSKTASSMIGVGLSGLCRNRRSRGTRLSFSRAGTRMVITISNGCTQVSNANVESSGGSHPFLRKEIETKPACKCLLSETVAILR
jgi:hypothetical protein